MGVAGNVPALGGLEEHVRDIVLLIDLETGQIVDANRAAEQAYQYSRAELLERTIFDLRVAAVTWINQQMKLADQDGILFEGVHRRRDGSEFPVEVSSRGETIGPRRLLLSIIRDITERKRQEAEREQLLDTLQHALASTEELLWVAARELPTPIAIVNQQLDELRRSIERGEPADRLTGAMTSALAQLDRLSTLVQSLFDGSRIANGRPSLERAARSDLGSMGADRVRRGLKLISTVVRTFSEATSDFQLLLETIARKVAQTIPDACAVLLRDPDGRMTATAVHDADPRGVAAFSSILGQPRGPEAAPLATAAIAQGSLLMPVLDMTDLRARMPGAPFEVLEAIGARGVLLVPLRSRGELLGVLAIIRHDPRHPPLDELDLELVEDLAGHAALALATSRLVHRLQEELARRKAAELATMFLDAIVDNIPDMVFVKDAERLAFVRLNRAGEALLGMTREQLVGKTDFDFFPPSEAEFFVAKDRQTLDNRTLVDIPEEPIHTRSGQRWLHTKKVPILDANGAPRFLLGISRDITDDKLAAARLAAAQRATEQTNRELEMFTYSVAHDLRMPLRAIAGYTQAVVEDHAAVLPDEAKRYLQRVHDSAHRMSHLLDDLVGLSRVTRAELVFARVDLTAIAHSVVAGLRAAVPGRAVEVSIAPELVAEGDARLLAVVLENLFDNAWKFTSKRPDARIELGARDGAFFIRDNGAGFDPAYADELFGAFRRLHPESEFPGTGIGLATVARIVHRHHGRVWAEGAVGEGATFYFALGEPP